eukprot:scaffold7.g3454.t1
MTSLACATAVAAGPRLGPPRSGPAACRLGPPRLPEPLARRGGGVRSRTQWAAPTATAAPVSRRKLAQGFVTEVEAGKPATEQHLAQGPSYRSPLTESVDMQLSEAKTLYDNWVESVARCPAAPCLGRRTCDPARRQCDSYSWLTYQEAGELVDDVASAMVRVGLLPHGRASVYGANSPEWMVAMQACNRQTVYCVPLYDVLGDSALDYIIDHSESTIVFVSADKLPVLAKALPPVASQVHTVVYWGHLGASAAPALEAIRELDSVQLYSFEEFASLGRMHPAPPGARARARSSPHCAACRGVSLPPRPDDICTIMYTSGTTGTPKGVLLSHRAVSCGANSLCFSLTENGIGFGPGDTYLSFLPLAHIYGRVVEEMMLSSGASIAYWSGEARQLPGDIRAAQPALFCSVPRVLERFESTIADKVKSSSPLKRALYHWAFAGKLAGIKGNWLWALVTPLLDWLVFKEISQQMLGSKIRLVSSGGAPLAKHIEEFMRVVSCANFVQGYGLTETCASTFLSHPARPDHLYTVGSPQPTFTLRLEAVPEMGYDPLGSPPSGEVLVKGTPLFSGYYKDDEETRRAMDAEGWFHTGDVGELTPAGALKIINRKKNSEYIAVEKIEEVLDESPLIAQAWIHGNFHESCLVAVVVPNKRRLEAWAREQGIEGEFADLCADSQVKRMLQHEIETTAKSGGLKPFEVPRALHLEPAPFSVDNELLTPTFELRRHQLAQRYKAEVDALYAGMRRKAH